MKRKFAIIMVLMVMLLTASPLGTPQNVSAEVMGRSIGDPAGPYSLVEPRWTYIASIITNLNISSLGRADCATSLATTSTNYLTKIHGELLQRMPGYYKVVDSWDVSGYGGVDLFKTTYVYSGYTYVLESQCSVWNKSGTTKLESQTVTYEEVYN